MLCLLENHSIFHYFHFFALASEGLMAALSPSTRLLLPLL
ncbi:hypothetical protein B4168_3343 [Anoxybacillus flavithermus]|nr:hypothetical protein B4168_3343 [Anoxybacillus flavithermus]OAO85085.1 hypothetical protein GT23_3139 [Parageobacillus thermoglucosidasius]